MKSIDLAIIGTGPAGISAATTAVRLGLEVILIGEDTRVGGQIFRQIIPPLQSQTSFVDKDYNKIFKCLNSQLKKSPIQFLNQTIVWGIFDNKVIATNNKDYPLIKAKKILISEGAYEIPVAFPGWTLPGVMTLGGIQIMLKSQGVIPRGKILVAGTGPLLYYTASQLVKNGANVVGILEASPLIKWIKWTVQLWRAPALLLKGLLYLFLLRKYGIPVYYSHLVVRAEGKDYLKKIVYAKADINWNPQKGTEKTLDIDTLCLNFGFIPSTTFSHMAGCEHEIDLSSRGWVPVVNEKGETSKEGIFVAGDCKGVGGVKKALLDGETVAIEVALQLGKISRPKAIKDLSRLKKNLSCLHWYQRFLKMIYAFRPGLIKLLTPETIICRCEEIDLSTILDNIKEGGKNINQIKRLSRAGMGRCQGRFCFPTLLGIFLQRSKPDELRKEDFSARPPVKPLPLREII